MHYVNRTISVLVRGSESGSISDKVRTCMYVCVGSHLGLSFPASQSNFICQKNSTRFFNLRDRGLSVCGDFGALYIAAHVSVVSLDTLAH